MGSANRDPKIRSDFDAVIRSQFLSRSENDAGGIEMRHFVA